MTGVDRWLFGVQILEAAVAVLVNMWCARRVPNAHVAQMFGAIAALSALYAILLTALVTGAVEPTWGITLLRGLSIVAWPAVWIAPPLLVVAAVPRFRRNLVAEVVSALEADRHRPVAHG